MVGLTGDAAWYRQRILENLTTTSDRYDLTYLFEMAGLLAEAGDADARVAMYARFADHAVAAPAAHDAHQIGAEALVRLDGFRGLLFVAERLTARPEPDDGWFGQSLLRLAREKDGDEAVDHGLARARAGSLRRAAYFDEAARVGSQSPPPRPRGIQDLTYDELRARIATEPSRLVIGSGYWGKRADDASVTRAARDLAGETDPARFLAYVGIFRQRAFPLDPAPLLAAAHGTDEKLAHYAFLALSQLRHPDVRRLALSTFADPARSHLAVALLERNYAPGDHLPIERALVGARDDDNLHRLGSFVLRVFEANLVPEATGPLTALYETGPCATCRERCFDLLKQIGALPDWMVRESAYDANFDLRQKARALLL